MSGVVEDPDGAPYPESVQEFARHWLPNVEPDELAVRDDLVAMLEDVVRHARARALAEVADTWQWKGWSDVLLPKPGDVLATAQRVTDWLRGRATAACALLGEGQS